MENGEVCDGAESHHISNFNNTDLENQMFFEKCSLFIWGSIGFNALRSQNSV